MFILANKDLKHEIEKHEKLKLLKMIKIVCKYIYNKKILNQILFSESNFKTRRENLNKYKTLKIEE
jgi:hypothetical protein